MHQSLVLRGLSVVSSQRCRVTAELLIPHLNAREKVYIYLQGFERGFWHHFNHKKWPHGAGHLPGLCIEKTFKSLLFPSPVEALVTNVWCCMVSVVRYNLSQLMLSRRQTAQAQASLRFRAVLPEPLLFAHTTYGPRGSFRQRATSQALLSGSACTF